VRYELAFERMQQYTRLNATGATECYMLTGRADAT